MESGGQGQFLPPEPPGPEPELSADAPSTPDEPRQPAPGSPPKGAQPPPRDPKTHGCQPPPDPQAHGSQQLPPNTHVQGWPQHGAGPQAEGWQQQPPPGWQPPPWAWYQPRPAEPDNGAAVGGFVTSVVSAALLVMSFGFVSVATLVAAPFGIYFSRKGKRAVDEGRTRKHRGLAQAGFVIGIVTVVLSLAATVVWALVIIAAVNDDGAGGGGRGPFDSTSAAAAIFVARVAGTLLG